MWSGPGSWTGLSNEILSKENLKFLKKQKFITSPERFELSRGNPMYLAGTRLNHSAKATVDVRCWYFFVQIRSFTNVTRYYYSNSINTIEEGVLNSVIEYLSIGNNKGSNKLSYKGMNFNWLKWYVSYGRTKDLRFDFRQNKKLIDILLLLQIVVIKSGRYKLKLYQINKLQCS